MRGREEREGNFSGREEGRETRVGAFERGELGEFYGSKKKKISGDMGGMFVCLCDRDSVIWMPLRLFLCETMIRCQ